MTMTTVATKRLRVDDDGKNDDSTYNDNNDNDDADAITNANVFRSSTCKHSYEKPDIGKANGSAQQQKHHNHLALPHGRTPPHP